MLQPHSGGRGGDPTPPTPAFTLSLSLSSFPSGICLWHGGTAVDFVCRQVDQFVWGDCFAWIPLQHVAPAHFLSLSSAPLPYLLGRAEEEGRRKGMQGKRRCCSVVAAAAVAVKPSICLCTRGVSRQERGRGRITLESQSQRRR